MAHLWLDRTRCAAPVAPETELCILRFGVRSGAPKTSPAPSPQRARKNTEKRIGMGTRSYGRSATSPSGWPRRLALLLAGSSLVLAGCAHVGLLKMPEHKTLAPIQPRTTPGSQTAPEENPTVPVGPLFAVGDTVLGFIPGT